MYAVKCRTQRRCFPLSAQRHIQRRHSRTRTDTAFTVSFNDGMMSRRSTRFPASSFLDATPRESLSLPRPCSLITNPSFPPPPLLQDIWDPSEDPCLPQHYAPDTVAQGKEAARRALRDRLGLAHSDVPIVGCVTRLVAQKVRAG